MIGKGEGSALTLREYLDSLRDRTVAVIGIGVSNTPLIELLAREGIAVTACDRRDRAALGELADKLESMGVRLQLGGDYLDHLHHDVIFRTPGLRPDVPQLRRAVEEGSCLTSEMEVFFRVCPCPIIAVTGSDGKTTTTTIIAELLKAGGYTVHVGGNIGNPLLCQAGEMQSTDYAVLELSSFQLMTMTCSPHIAVITNLAPNHLDVHRDMAEYVAAKENIFRYQGPEDVAVFIEEEPEYVQGPVHLNYDGVYKRVYKQILKETREGNRNRCPFCGSEDLLSMNTCLGSWILCNNCKAGGPMAKTEKEAWKLWRKRIWQKKKH